MTKAMLVVGTRPQIIKVAPLLEECGRCDLELQLVHTGQHYDFELSKAFFDEFNLPSPLVDLEVGSGPHGWQTGRMLTKLEKVIDNLLPDIMVVVGDCNSTLAGALAASKLNVPVAHVEAGCRTYDGIPEEVNRVLTDHCSTWLFASSENCVLNLRREGLLGIFVGDLLYDSLLKHLPEVQHLSPFEDAKPYILLTLHRPENVDNVETLSAITSAISELGMNTIFSVHPRTKKTLHRIDSSKNSAFSYFSPLKHRVFLSAVLNSELVITDSGGLVKEAFWLKKPCVTIRDRVEWLETVEAGCNLLVAKSKRAIVEGAEKMLHTEIPTNYPNPFGDGNAACRIVRYLEVMVNRLTLKRNEKT